MTVSLNLIVSKRVGNSNLVYLARMVNPQTDERLPSGRNVYALMQLLVVCLCLLSTLITIKVIKILIRPYGFKEFAKKIKKTNCYM